MHRAAFECVVKILAMHRRAVDERGAGRAQGARMADCGAASVVVPAGKRRLDVVLAARGEAQPDHVDVQILALAYHCVRQPRGTSGCVARDLRVCRDERAKLLFLFE